MAMTGELVVIKEEPIEMGKDDDSMEATSPGDEEDDASDSQASIQSLTVEEVQQAQQKLRRFQKMGLIEVEIGENDRGLATISNLSGTPISSQLMRSNSEDKSTFLLSPKALDSSQIHLQIQKLQNSSSSETSVNSTQLVTHGLDSNGIISFKTVGTIQTTNDRSAIGPSEAEVDVPNLTPDSGMYGFEVSLEDREDTMRTPTWLMSKVTNKLYININKPVPFHIRLMQKIPRTNLTVRVMAVFNNHQFLRTIVARCPNHSSLSEQTNIDFQHPDHVVRVDHPSAQYEKSSTGRLSVVVPLELIPGTHGEASPILVKFMCLNSCVGGIHRRPLAVMFSLEENGLTVGRHVVDVRVCACPARDFKNDELTKGLKRSSSAPVEYKLGKKKMKHILPKVKDEETELYLLPVKGVQLYEYLKEMKSLYLRHHPEYAEKYPDIEDYFQDKYSEPITKDWSRTDFKDCTRSDQHVTTSLLNNGSTSMHNMLLVDKLDSARLIETQSVIKSPSKLKAITHTKSESEVSITQKVFKNEEDSDKISFTEVSCNGVLNDNPCSFPVTTSSNNKITISRALFNGSNSNQRHIPFVSVTPYLPGSNVIPKSKKMSDGNISKRKYAQIHRVGSDKEVNITVEPITEKNCDINKDEMMAIELLASNMSSRDADLCTELSNSSLESDLDKSTRTNS